MSLPFAGFLLGLLFDPGERCMFLSNPTSLHSDTSQKMALFIVTIVKTSNSTKIILFEDSYILIFKST
jgi:hypothetical protein